LKRPLLVASLSLQFLLELAALIALGYWGSTTGAGTFAHIVLAIVAPLLGAIVWGVFGSPKAPFHLRGAWRLVLEVVFFGSAVAALVSADQPVLGAILAATVTVNVALLHALGEGDVAPSWRPA
jgi:amino acid transporter